MKPQARPIIRLPRSMTERHLVVRNPLREALRSFLIFVSVLLAVALTGVAALAAGQVSPNFVMQRDAINNGVGQMASANFILLSSLGDAVAGGAISSVSFQLQNGFRATVNAPPAVLNLLSVFSRKLHNGTPFDLTIDRNQLINGTITVEPRAIGAGHTIVFRFDNPVTAAGAATALDAALNSAASVTLARTGNDVIATLTNVADNRRLTLTLTGVNGTGPVSAAVGFLVGDVGNTRAVTAADVSALKANLGRAINSIDVAKFDLNADGSITQADVAAVKARSGKVLSP